MADDGPMGGATSPELDIDTCDVHGSDEWSVTCVNGDTFVVPQDTRHRLAREVLAWQTAGGTIGNGETSMRRRVRSQLKSNPALRCIVKELADMQSITPLAMRTKLVGHLGP